MVISMWFVKVNIACALRWGVVSVGFTLLGVVHPIRDNNLGVGNTPVDGSHLRPRE